MSAWVRAWEWCLKTQGVPDILRKVAEKRAGPILNKRARPKAKPPIRFPRGKDPKKVKKDLHAECEALCKALVFHRDCGGWFVREGICFTCGHYQTLQWGHFIERQKAPALRYSERATAGQCSQCNGHGKGMPWEFSAAIDKREGFPAAAALMGSYYKKPFTWNKSTLTTERDRLARACQEKGLPVATILQAVRREAPGERLREPVPPLTPPLNPPNLEKA
jgi:hypothetical protein